MDNVLDQFADKGLQVESLEASGRLIRCKTDLDKGSKKSGWYVAHEFQKTDGGILIFGRFGNWKDSQCPDSGWEIEQTAHKMSDAEREAYKREQQAARKKAEQEKQQRAEEAATKAVGLWVTLPKVGSSEYLKRKKVKAFGLRFTRGSIVVPVRDVHGDLHGLQFIDGDGNKKFLTGTAKRGKFALLGEINPAGRLFMAEGYATGATIHMAFNEPVVVAFDAGNLEPVAQAIKGVYPKIEIIICADNDIKTPGNPGVTKAIDALVSIGGGVMVRPVFGESEGVA